MSATIHAFQQETCLGDKVRREVRLALLLVLERVMRLGVRHRARLEPAVKDLRNALQHTLALFGRNREAVDRLAVQVGNRPRGLPGELLEVRDRLGDNNFFMVLGGPNREGRAPVPVAGDRPVLGSSCSQSNMVIG